MASNACAMAQHRWPDWAEIQVPYALSGIEWSKTAQKGSRFVTLRASIAIVLLSAFAGMSAAAAPRTVVPAARPGGGDALPIASDVRLGGDDSQTRFVIDLSQKIDMAAFTLADPYRVVIDLPQVSFNLPAKIGDTGRGLVKAFRFGLVMQGGSRIVLDIKKPAKIEKAFVLDAADGQPARLVLDLAATDRESFLRAIALDNHPARKTAVATPPVEAASGDPRPLVVIDPGHGGIDTGTKASSGETEKSIVLDFATILRDKIEKAGKYRVAMTRTDDTFVPLPERVRFARSLKASLFISIHADYLPRNEGAAQGATVYTLSENASDSEAARLAEAENKADVIAGVDLTSEPNDVADILIDLAQRETKTFSSQFAHTLVDEIKTSTRMHKHPMKSAGFMVLRAPDVPSVLVELGYVSTKDDLKELLSSEWRTRTADAVVRAVDSFLAPRMAGAGIPGRPN
jgi:N-acetylmuramoyl-L-alanine amidase